MTTRAALPFTVRRLFSLLVALLMVGLAGCRQDRPVAAPAAEALTLSPGLSREVVLRGGETKAFNLRLPAGTFLLLAVYPRSLNLSGPNFSARLLDPSGKTVATGEGGKILGAQLLAMVADRAGLYRLELISRRAQSPPGPCTLRALEVRPGRPGDEARARGAKELAEARRLLSLSPEKNQAQAEALISRSLASWRAGRDARGEVEALFEIADLQMEKDVATALSWYGKAARRSLASGFAEGEARALNRMGYCSLQLQRPQEAVENYLRSLDLWKKAGGPYEKAYTTQGLANVYYSQGNLEAALKTYREALGFAVSAGDRSQQAGNWAGIGIIDYVQYRFDSARENWEKALDLSRRAGDESMEANIGNNLAVYYQNRGQFQKALDLLLRVAARKPFQDSGMIRYNIGNLYTELGDLDKALQSYTLSQAAFHATANPNEVRALVGRGSIYQRRGNTGAALAEFEKARRLKPEKESWSLLHSTALARMDLGQPREALPLLEQALETASGDQPERAATLLALGTAYAKLGEAERAAENLSQAIATGSRIGYQSVVALAYLRRAQLRRDQGSLERALADVEKAIGVVESTRRNLASDQFRTGFFAAKRIYYDLNIELLLRLDRRRPGKGYRVRALEATERARARGLLDLLAEGRIDLRQGLDPDLRQREDALSDRISQVQSELRSGATRPERSQALSAELDQLNQRWEDLGIEIQGRNKRYAEVRYPLPLSLDQIRDRVLDDRTVLLEYVLQEKSSTLFVITREAIETYDLPGAGQIADQVRRVRRALERDSLLTRRDYLEAAFQLYRDLLEPAAGTLAEKPNLLIVPDGALYYLPFEALLTEPAGGRAFRDLPYLLRRHPVTYIPSASVLAGLREPRPEPPAADREQVVAFAPFAAPGQEASSGGTGGGTGRWSFEPLPASRREISAIAGLYPGAALSFVGEQADEEAVTRDERVAGARRLHFATHARIDERHPEDSALVLAEHRGEDGLLQAREIFNLKLSADLAVLSACQTALGKEVTGEGLIGLSRAFFYAGVPSLVVSLWNVIDSPTPELMLDFYRNLDRPRDKAEALQGAKLAMIGRGVYAHPSYWAPFILLGEPR